MAMTFFISFKFTSVEKSFKLYISLRILLTFIQVLFEEMWSDGAAYEVAGEAQGPHQVDGGGRRR
jgi:hypothetical protein